MMARSHHAVKGCANILAEIAYFYSSVARLIAFRCLSATGPRIVTSSA